MAQRRDDGIRSGQMEHFFPWFLISISFMGVLVSAILLLWFLFKLRIFGALILTSMIMGGWITAEVIDDRQNMEIMEFMTYVAYDIYEAGAGAFVSFVVLGLILFVIIAGFFLRIRGD